MRKGGQKFGKLYVIEEKFKCNGEDVRERYKIDFKMENQNLTSFMLCF